MTWNQFFIRQKLTEAKFHSDIDLIGHQMIHSLQIDVGKGQKDKQCDGTTASVAASRLRGRGFDSINRHFGISLQPEPGAIKIFFCLYLLYQGIYLV